MHEAAHRESQAVRDALASAQEETEVLNQAISEATIEADGWKTKFDDLSTEFELARANWTEREEELMATKAEAEHAHNAAAPVYDEALKKLEAELAVFVQEKGEWEKKHAALVAQVAELRGKCDEKETQFAHINEEHNADIEGWRQKYLDLNLELERNSEDAEKLALLLKEKDEEVERLTALVEENEINRSALPEPVDTTELRAELEEAKQEGAKVVALVKEEAERHSAVLKEETDRLNALLKEETERLTAVLKEETEKLAAFEKNASEQSAVHQTIETEKVKLEEALAVRTKECERLVTLLTEKEEEKEKEKVKLEESLAERTKECERLVTLLTEKEEEKEKEKVKLEEALAERTKECDRLVNLLTEKEKEKDKELAEKDKECQRLSQLAASNHALQRAHDQSILIAADFRVIPPLLLPCVPSILNT
jgi:hypothetical protein